ncbi:MAG: DUF4492 domain-containing protein [Bacteroidales bacterium]|nr:DUF4492 domain-containing protein [Bacteroidales bacterium]MDY6075996.1 DUF4492 domain-containing protein [Bacteroidales bacterium]
MDRVVSRLKSIANFYIDGFKNMTWGRPLWMLIILKLIILFAILRVFFFKPVLAGKSEDERSEFVGEMLMQKDINDTIKIKH